MKKHGYLLFIMTVMLLLSLGASPGKAQEFDRSQYIYDFAHVLTDKQAEELQALSSELGKERDTAFLVITVDGTDGKGAKKYMQDFYDEHAPGYDKPHGNTAIIIIDLEERDVYLAGFKKARQYLDDSRLDQIREKITPDLSNGEYFQAFSAFMQTSYDYMAYEPGVNPENILFKWWFQIAASVALAAVVVGLMVYRTGGKAAVNAYTYMDKHKSKVISKYDHFVNVTVTKQKKPSNDSKSGGGGGITSGGHSHSGSGGKF